MTRPSTLLIDGAALGKVFRYGEYGSWHFIGSYVGLGFMEWLDNMERDVFEAGAM
jgi:hypothetical protein